MPPKEARRYAPGDIIAIYESQHKALSCKVIEQGIGETKNGTIIYFNEEDVVWKLGFNGKWPTFVYKLFRGEHYDPSEISERHKADIERQRTSGARNAHRYAMNAFKVDKYGKTKSI